MSDDDAREVNEDDGKLVDIGAERWAEYLETSKAVKEAVAAKATDAQRAFLAALARLGEVQREVRELSWNLPPLTAEIVANAQMSWRNSPAQIVEDGYTRWTDLENAAVTILGEPAGEPEWHASTNGWDDYSDEGAYEYVEVDDLPYKLPDAVDHD